jgi:ubiquinone/menaquinone biosynthesis C-methylase UbiE
MEKRSHQQTIIEQFTLQAAPFARHQAHSVQESFDFIRHMARLGPASRVVDAGCGPGLVSCALAPHCREVTGVDVTRAMLDEAARKAGEQGLENVSFVESGIEAMPFADGAFDAAVSRYVFHHLENPAAAFAEMIRVTRPGGRVVICDAAPAASRRDGYDTFEKKRDASHTKALTLEEFVGLGEAFDLGEVTVRRFALPVELDSLLDSSFPEAGKKELQQMMRSDVGRDEYGFSAREEAGKLFITFPISVLGWTKG